MILSHINAIIDPIIHNKLQSKPFFYFTFTLRFLSLIFLIQNHVKLKQQQFVILCLHIFQTNQKKNCVRRNIQTQ